MIQQGIARTSGTQVSGRGSRFRSRIMESNARCRASSRAWKAQTWLIRLSRRGILLCTIWWA
jgi:hypothetical protein